MVTVGWKRKVQKHGNSLQVTLPSELCEALGIIDGDIVTLAVEENSIIIEKGNNKCKHCYGTGSCRCSACAKASGTFLTRPVLIPVTCSVCGGSGKLELKR